MPTVDADAIERPNVAGIVVGLTSFLPIEAGSVYVIERTPRRFKALQWTGENLEEVRELDPWGIYWDEHTQMLYLNMLPVQVSDWLVDEPGGVSVLSPELFAMQFVPAADAA
jgi:hypothetical protein